MPRSVNRSRINRNYRKRTQRRKIRGGDGGFDRILKTITGLRNLGVKDIGFGIKFS